MPTRAFRAKQAMQSDSAALNTSKTQMSPIPAARTTSAKAVPWCQAKQAGLLQSIEEVHSALKCGIPLANSS